MSLNNQTFYLAYRNALYEGFLSDKNSPQPSIAIFKELKRTLDDLEPSFLKGDIGTDDLIAKTKLVLKQPSSGISPLWNPGRDICIVGSMAVGAALCAAWVTSGGTLTVGVAAAGVTITTPIYAALVGGASVGTIACLIGSCGDC